MNFARKKQLRNGVLLSVLAGTMLLSATAWAEGKVEVNQDNIKDKVSQWSIIKPGGDENTVEIKDVTDVGTALGSDKKLNAVYGAEQKSDDPLTGYTVTVTDSTLKQWTGAAEGDNLLVYGANQNNAEGKGAVTGNKVIIDNSTIGKGHIRGAYTAGSGAVGGENEADGNSVEIKGGSTVAASVYGGHSDSSGTVSGNHVTITDKSTVATGDTTYGVIGGRSKTGEASSNSVTVEGGSTVETYVYGGDSTESGDTDNNKVLITGEGTTVTGNVYGGHAGEYKSKSGNAKGNSITISEGATVGDEAKGKRSFIVGAENHADIGGEGEGEGNSVTVTGKSTVYGDIIGGLAAAEAGKNDPTGDVVGNTVTVDGGSRVTLTKDGLMGGQNQGSGDVRGNSVLITGEGTTVDQKSGIGVEGGSSWGRTGYVTGNSVEISGGATVNSWVRGGTDNGASHVTQNKVTVSGRDSKGKATTVTGDVIGGYTTKEQVTAEDEQNISNNTVAVYDGGTVNGIIRGGRAGKLQEQAEGGTSAATFVENNRVYIGYDENGVAKGPGYVGSEESDTYYAVRGGATNGNDNVTNNEVRIGNKSVIYGSVSGGYIDEGGNGVATQNKVYIDNSSVEGQAGLLNGIYGGRTLGSGTVSLNEVHISHSEISENIYGGSSEDPNSREIQPKAGAVIDQNKVYIEENATITGNVYGGRVVGESTATANEVTIETGSKVEGNVYGALSEGDGKIEGNQVTIQRESEVTGNIYGGYSQGNGAANGNWVHIVGSTIERKSETEGNIYGAYAAGSGNMSGNIVGIEADENGNASTITGNVYGAYTRDNRGKFDNNEVHITGGSTVKGGIAGVFVDVSGNTSDDKQGTHNNKVAIVDGTVEGNAWGAQNYVGDLINNQVVVYGNGTVEGTIGAARSDHKNGAIGEDGITISDNKVYLLGDTQGNFANVENADVYGVYFGDPHEHSNLGHKGNAIYFGNAKDSDGKRLTDDAQYENDVSNSVWRGTVNSLSNFDEMRYAQFDWETNDVIVKVTEGNNSDLSLLTDVWIEDVNFKPGTRVEAGDRMTLLDIDTLVKEGTDYGAGGDGLDFHLGEGGAEKKFTFEQGVSTEVTVEAKVKDGDMIMEVTGTKSQAQNEPIAEARAMAMAFVNISEDLIHEVLNDLGRDHLEGIKTFAFGYGTKSTYDLGDGLKLNGWSFLTGIDNARHIGKDDEELNFTLFFETGTGNFRIFNTFYDGEGNATHFRGDGGMIYNGGGIAARFQKKNGVYYEGSVRGGVLKNNIGNGFMDKNHNTYGYNSENKYFGCHAGIGRIVSTGEHSVFNMYAKYFHTYTEKDSWTLFNGEGGTVGDYYDLDGIKSDRVRVGGRVLTHKGHPNQYYYGLAYEYEFSGDVHLKASGAPVDADSLKGGTGILELGFNYKKDPNSPWSFDLNTKGYVGAREGVSAQLQATYTF